MKVICGIFNRKTALFLTISFSILSKNLCMACVDDIKGIISEVLVFCSQVCCIFQRLTERFKVFLPVCVGRRYIAYPVHKRLEVQLVILKLLDEY